MMDPAYGHRGGYRIFPGGPEFDACEKTVYGEFAREVRNNFFGPPLKKTLLGTGPDF